MTATPGTTCPRCSSPLVVTLRASKGGTPLVLQCQNCNLQGDVASFPVNGVLPQ